MCISGGREKFWLRKRGVCDLIPKSSATSDRSDPTKAHLHSNTQEQHLGIRVCLADVRGQQANNTAMALPTAEGKGRAMALWLPA